jgi:hypothetical protein
MSLPLKNLTGDVFVEVNGTPVSWNRGVGYAASGRMCVTDTVSASDVWLGGYRLDTLGRMVCGDGVEAARPYVFVSGLPTDKRDGRLIRQLNNPIGWTPANLFASGEQGAWYDPSDFSTMFQDSAGTTPVTAVGQLVGLILDKSKGLALGSELVTNGTFNTDISGWTKAAGSTDPLSWDAGTLKVTNDLAYYASGYTVLSGLTIGKTYKCVATNVQSTIQAKINIVGLSGVESIIPSGATGTLYFVATATSHNLSCASNQNTLGGYARWDNISVKELAGNHATQATAASRPVLQQDGNGKYYLNFDGVDDSLATAAFAMTSTSKVTAFSGVTNNQPSSFGMVYTFGANPLVDDGAFGLYTYISASGDYSPALRGTVQYYAKTAGATIPRTDVLTASYDVTATVLAGIVKLRANASDQSITTVSGGLPSGTVFGTWPLYIGQRGVNDSRLNGRIYSLIIRGALSTAQEITDTETWVNSKTGAY